MGELNYKDLLTKEAWDKKNELEDFNYEKY